MDISSIDRNFKIETNIGEDDVVFYDVRRAPFKVYGLYDYQNQPDFKRCPDEVAHGTSTGVAYLNTAGGRVRFATDSRYIAIKAEMPSVCHMNHMPLTGISAFDLYVDVPETTAFNHAFRPDYHFVDGYESKKDFGTRKMRYVTIYTWILTAKRARGATKTSISWTARACSAVYTPICVLWTDVTSTTWALRS